MVAKTIVSLKVVKELIKEQFPEYGDLPIKAVKEQGHDNRTYRLGDELLLRMPTAESYALKVPIEQEFLPLLAPNITIAIPTPIKMGLSSKLYPFNFSIYKWIAGESGNNIKVGANVFNTLALQLANFLKELQAIHDVVGPQPGSHNWWRGSHPSIYNRGARKQIAKLENIINAEQAIKLWGAACDTKWQHSPVWIHGDFAVSNFLLKDNNLVGVIDFGGMAVGDPACDLVIAWTFLKGNSREIFIKEMNLASDVWLRARAWALWKATFELCQLEDKNNDKALIHKQIISDVLE